ncbi:MAG TPA: hypothetical protein GX736_05285 [Mogibacterium sp.]|nr:hypothetical protein [Mogibacterium sp.]
MKKNNIKLYNLFFPIWLLWLIPLAWIVILPANFVFDLLIVVLTMKYLKIEDIKINVKASIFYIWIFGFLADCIGCTLMYFAYEFYPDTEFGEWWFDNISIPVASNPFENIYSFICVTVCVIVSAFFIYRFNHKTTLAGLNLPDEQKKKIALSLALFTAPYLFYLPTEWVFGPLD